ncbi:Centromere protein 3 [Smittium mucronatum]|uniref:Centromere protein 3 n=1 Tax=Smittium mucronatum TaxID=133383 RepID=A0A1R0GXB7_9FUNG|nr:Centromere protein 3 [Smittium mucronatum]
MFSRKTGITINESVDTDSDGIEDVDDFYNKASQDDSDQPFSDNESLDGISRLVLQNISPLPKALITSYEPSPVAPIDPKDFGSSASYDSSNTDPQFIRNTTLDSQVDSEKSKNTVMANKALLSSIKDSQSKNKKMRKSRADRKSRLLSDSELLGSSLTPSIPDANTDSFPKPKSFSKVENSPIKSPLTNNTLAKNITPFKPPPQATPVVKSSEKKNLQYKMNSPEPNITPNLRQKWKISINNQLSPDTASPSEIFEFKAPDLYTPISKDNKSDIIFSPNSPIISTNNDSVVITNLLSKSPISNKVKVSEIENSEVIPEIIEPSVIENLSQNDTDPYDTNLDNSSEFLNSSEIKEDTIPPQKQVEDNVNLPIDSDFIFEENEQLNSPNFSSTDVPMDLDDAPSSTNVENDFESPIPVSKKPKILKNVDNTKVTPEVSGEVRKSTRTKIKPLDFWRNEHIVYKLEKTEDGNVVPSMKGVVKLEDKSKKPKRKKRTRITMPRKPPSRSTKKKIDYSSDSTENGTETLSFYPKEEKPVDYLLDKELEMRAFEAKADVVDYYTQKLVKRTVALSAPAVRSRLSPDNEESPEFYTAGIFSDSNPGTKPFVQSGLIEIPPNSEKPPRNTKSCTIVFYVCHGSIKVTFRGSPILLEMGSHFCVPRGNSYSIFNPGPATARIFFVSSSPLD